MLTLHFVATQSAQSSFLHRTFRPDGALFERMIPAAITLLLFWTLADLLLKWTHVRRQRIALRKSVVAELPMEVAKNGAAAATGSLDGLSRSEVHLPVMSRLLSLLELISSTGDVQRSHEAFRHQAELAADKAAASYSTARVFIWAMPILGFIGTVLGIGAAVGDFSGFLTGTIDDVEVVKTELSKIASGLSFAFDTTLLGLLASLPSMVFMSFVQRAEEWLGSALEGLGLSIIASVPDAQNAAASHVAPELDDGLLLRVARGIDALDRDFAILESEMRGLGGTVSSLVDSTNAVEGSMTSLSTAQSNLLECVDSVRTAVAPLPLTIERASDDILVSANKFCEGLESALQPIPDRARKSSLEMAEVIESAAGRMANGIEASTRCVVASIDGIASHLAQLDAYRDDANVLGQVVERLLLQITELQRVHKQSIDAVSTFSEPFEFRLVPRPNGSSLG